MKFEPTRVLVTVNELCDPRFSGPDGELYLADFVSMKLAGAGWEVNRTEASISRGPTTAISPVLVARRPTEMPPSLRILIHAQLSLSSSDDLRSGLGNYLRGWLGRKPEELPTPILTHADVSGIAMVTELARTWPKARARRFELVLAATLNRHAHVGGAGALAREFDPARTGVPTLFMPLFAPGLGRELILIGGRSRELALACAISLWIPVSPSGSQALSRRYWPSAAFQTFPDHVALIGGDIEKEMPSPLDGNALRHTSDLIAEIALRWATATAASSLQADEARSDARSSQKPG